MYCSKPTRLVKRKRPRKWWRLQVFNLMKAGILVCTMDTAYSSSAEGLTCGSAAYCQRAATAGASEGFMNWGFQGAAQPPVGPPQSIRPEPSVTPLLRVPERPLGLLMPLCQHHQALERRPPVVSRTVCERNCAVRVLGPSDGVYQARASRAGTHSKGRQGSLVVAFRAFRAGWNTKSELAW